MTTIVKLKRKQAIDEFAEVLNSYINESKEEAGHILIQYWTQINTESAYIFGTYMTLTTPGEVFRLVCRDQEDESLEDPAITKSRERISSFRSQAVAHTYGFHPRNDQELICFPGRVYINRRAEESPDINHYSPHEYPLKDLALNFGIKASLYLPLFFINSFCSDSVIEFLFTSDQMFHRLKRVIYEKYWSLTSTLSTDPERGYICRNHTSLIDDMPRAASKEIKHLLTAVCQKYSIPLAQCWVPLSGDRLLNCLRLSHASSSELQFSIHWHKFKEACSIFCSDASDCDLVSMAFFSGSSYFCRDISELSITKYPLAHHVRNCGSVTCFTIRLRSKIYDNCALEFFVPHEEIDVSYPQTYLNPLFTTLKEHLLNYTIDLSEGKLCVVVYNSSHSVNESFELGDSVISLPHHEPTQHERDEVPLPPLNCQSTVADSKQLDQNVLAVAKNCSTIGEISSARDDAAEIIYDKPAEQSLMEDVGDTTHTESQPYSIKKLLPQVQGTEIEEETVVLDPSNQQLRLQDSRKTKAIIVGAHKDSAPIHITKRTRVEGTAQEEKPEKSISFESLTEHFGTPLDDAAKSFGVSRSTFKRICRSHDIKRWKSSKRRVDSNISSKVTRINNEETSRRNFSKSGMLSEQDTPIVVHTHQDINEMMTVKATYEGVTIRFDLLYSSGLRDLEDNVIERLHLERKNFTIKYLDDDDDWILIACDKDVHKCMEISRSLKKSTIKMLIDRPLHYCAP